MKEYKGCLEMFLHFRHCLETKKREGTSTKSGLGRLQDYRVAPSEGHMVPARHNALCGCSEGFCLVQYMYDARHRAWYSLMFAIITTIATSLHTARPVPEQTQLPIPPVHWESYSIQAAKLRPP
jgi:hypothetical protein